MRVSVPASSANLGPGFDALGLALDLPFLLSSSPGGKAIEMEATHPAYVAFSHAGGKGRLWWASGIPPGRGLGFSGSARVAGAFMGLLQGGKPEAEAKPIALGIACELEGHPDNAAASMLGGLTVAAGGRAIRLKSSIADVFKVVVWWPSTETSTKRARAALPDTVPFEDAVFNVGRASLLVAALASGDRGALLGAIEDRLHQDTRLAMSPASAVALQALRDCGVPAWLSGSGPTVAAFVDPEDTPRILAALPANGTARVLDIDTVGARSLRT